MRNMPDLRLALQVNFAGAYNYWNIMAGTDWGMRRRLGRLITLTGITITRVGRLVRGCSRHYLSRTRLAGIDIAESDLTKLQYFDLFRTYRIREHDLLNYRLTWNLTIQGFLFVTYGYCVQKLAELESGENGAKPCLIAQSHAVAQLKRIIWIIPPAGLALSITICFAVFAAYSALKKLKTDWNDKIASHHRPYLPDPAGAGAPLSRWGVIAPISIPIIFFFAWLWIWASTWWNGPRCVP